MTLPEATNLIKGIPFIPGVPATWADLGCGEGLFSRALTQILPAGSAVYAIDAEKQKIALPTNGIPIEFIQADFVKDSLSLPPLDGLLMANSLHYVRDKKKFLDRMQSHLHHDSRWLIVEYDTMRSNPWVPYPVDFKQLEQLFKAAGHSAVTKMGEHPSRFHQGNIYSALVS